MITDKTSPAAPGKELPEGGPGDAGKRDPVDLRGRGQASFKDRGGGSSQFHPRGSEVPPLPGGGSRGTRK